MPTASGHTVRAVAGAISSASSTTVNNAGGVVNFMQNNFLPRVQIYLDAQGGAEMPSTFPANASHADQFNWIIENSLSYVDGQIVLTVN